MHEKWRLRPEPGRILADERSRLTRHSPASIKNLIASEESSNLERVTMIAYVFYDCLIAIYYRHLESVRAIMAISPTSYFERRRLTLP
jgi:hypothetical protein